MPAFVCDSCGCIDNTATGHWHARNIAKIWPPEYVGKALCCVCAPPRYATGEVNQKAGKWHDKFPRIWPTPEIFKTCKFMNRDAHGNPV